MSDTATAPGPQTGSDADRTLTITRRYAAAREIVFRAWADPAELVKWWGPEGMTTPVCEMDVRPGGAWRTAIVGDQGTEHVCSGVYRAVEAPSRLEFTWAWETDGVRGHETIVTLDFHERDGGTEMVFTQSVFESAESRRQHNEGWSSAFECLQRHLSA